MQAIFSFLKQLGWLRCLLGALALVIVVLAPDASAREQYSGWAFIPTVLVPALGPLVFMVLMLDALMTFSLRGEAGEAGRGRVRIIVRADLLLGAAILVALLPYFLSIGRA